MAAGFVVRAYRHRGVTEHRLGAGGGDHEVAAAIRKGITDVPQMPVFLLREHLEIGYRGVQHRIPIDEPATAVNEAFVVEANESFPHRARQPLVHREAFVGPVYRSAHASKLARDRFA